MMSATMSTMNSAQHIILRVFFCSCFASCRACVPPCTYSTLRATCFSMLSSISPCASTSTAMSRKIWCSSSRLCSRSLTARWRSWISASVSSTRPRPCSSIAFWKMFSASPVSIMRSMSSSAMCWPVTVYTRRSTTSLYSSWIVLRRSLNSPMRSFSFFLSPAVMVVRVRSPAVPSPCPLTFFASSFCLSRASTLVLTLCASTLTWLILSCISFLCFSISLLLTMVLLFSCIAMTSRCNPRISAMSVLMSSTDLKNCCMAISCSVGGASNPSSTSPCPE
mmetsp:Transcript_29299/g.74633  ORF Transcript_29299/g.74633 Transcript_29299/m.74633 type:complete len:279 (-) Transcript_29299:274-1110(-)